MTNVRFIKKIILYSSVNKIYWKNNYFLNNLILIYKIISKQNPLRISKKNNIKGLKCTLVDSYVDCFLYKFINFTIPKISKNRDLNDNFFEFDHNYNMNFIIKNQNDFFEYKTSTINSLNCVFNIKLIFDEQIDIIDRIDYIDKILKIKLKTNAHD